MRDQLAKYAHRTWSGWMAYLFSKAEFKNDGSVVIPAWAVKRWRRQMLTPYNELPENEKESDRSEADKIISICSKDNTRLRAALEKACEYIAEQYLCPSFACEWIPDDGCTSDCDANKQGKDCWLQFFMERDDE